jgi:hypothetical protein
VSVKVTPFNATVELGLVTVKVRLVVPFSGMLVAPKDFAMAGGATTVIVAMLLVPPVPPLAADTFPVVLFLTPAVVPVTVTLKEQLLLAAIDPPLNVMTFDVIEYVPPHAAVAAVSGAVNPAGNVSVNATPVKAVVVFGLVIVKLSTLVPPSGIVDASKPFIIDGGPTTVSIAVLLVAPVPLSFELMFPVVLLQTPVVAPVTVTKNEQLPLAASEPPLKLIRFGAVVETMPPQVAVGPAVGTVIPAGRVSVKAMPVRPCVEFGLVMLKVRLVVPFRRMLDAPNDFMSVGGVATFIVTVAMLVQPPGLFSTYLNVSTPTKFEAGR